MADQSLSGARGFPLVRLGRLGRQAKSVGPLEPAQPAKRYAVGSGYQSVYRTLF